MSSHHDEEQLPDYETGGQVASGALVALLIIGALAGIIAGAFLLLKNREQPPVETAAPTASAEATPTEPAVPNPCPVPTVQAKDKPEQFPAVPPAAEAPKGISKVTFETTCGKIVAEVDGTKAPQAVSSFIFLAKKNFFNDTLCHRLTVKGIYVLQCGDPTATGTGGPGYRFGPIENAPADNTYRTGTLAMARTADPNSNGSQFFMVYKDSEIPANGGAGYTVFGKITEGMDVINKIAEGGISENDQTSPKRPIALQKVTVSK